MTSQALAKTLGLKGPTSLLNLIETIRQGLPKQALERLAEALRGTELFSLTIST